MNDGALKEKKTCPYKRMQATLFFHTFKPMFRRHISALVVLLLCNFLQAQNRSIDSVKAILASAKDDTSKVKTLNALTTLYYLDKSDNHLALAFESSRTGLKLATRLGYNRGIAYAYYSAGMCYNELKKQDSALYCYITAIKFLEKEKDWIGMGDMEYRISRTYFYMNNAPEASHHAGLTIAYMSKADHPGKLAQAYMLKAVVVQNVKDSAKAAEPYFRIALQLAEQASPERLGYMYNNFGEYIVDHSENLDEALHYFNKAKQAGDGHDSAVICYANFCIAKVLMRRKEFAQAKQLILSSMSFWYHTNRLEDVLFGLDKLSDCMYGMGDYKACVYYVRRTQQLHDSINKLTNEENMNELETKYEVEKKDKELAFLREKTILETLEKEKQQNRNTILLIGVAALMVFGGFVLFALNNKRKANRLLGVEKNLVQQQKDILEIKNREILDSITYAKRIQNAILPDERLFAQAFEQYFILYKPKDIVAGDFYWFYKKGNCHYVAVCDCTGHGVPGALVSVICFNSMERALNEFELEKPGEILDKTRELVKKAFASGQGDVNDGMDIAMCCIEKKGSLRRVQWAGANNAAYYVSGGVMQELGADKQPVGNYAAEKPFATREAELPAGTVLYLLSDGYADQFGGPKGKKFKHKQLSSLLLEISGRPLSEQKAILEQAFEAWRGHLDQVDDVCVIGLRI